MPIINPKKFGLGVQNKLGDLKNPATALKALGISGNDLSIIYNSRSGNPSVPVSFSDVRGFSRLSDPLWETLDRYYYESGSYASIVPKRSGIDTILFGGLKIQGQLSGSAIRYRYVDGYGTGRIGLVSATASGTYTTGEYSNLSPVETVQVTVTKDAGNFSSVQIFETVFHTNAVGTQNIAFPVQTEYQCIFTGVAKARIANNGRTLETEDSANGDDDYNDLVLTVNKGRFYESGGTFYYKLDIPSELTGDGKATFNVKVDNNGIPTLSVGNRGNGYSTGNTLKLMSNQVGGGYNASKDMTITVTTIHTSDKIADISTSRVSAWSSADPRATNPDLSIQKLARISYGARIGIRDNSFLKFGQTTGYQYPQDPNDATSSDLVKLQTTIVPSSKLFNITGSPEIPTSKIKCTINGKELHLYAMKGIPVVFKGYFRTLSASIEINTINLAGVDIVPCWRIIRTETTEQSKYQNAKSIYYSSSISRDRFVEIYYSPDNITSITMPSALIYELPVAKFRNLINFNLSSNDIKDFPNFNELVPIKTDEGKTKTTLRTINLSNNPLYNSENIDERRLNGKIVDKIPDSVEEIHLQSTFYGEIPLTYTPGASADNANVGTNIKLFSKFSNLLTFNLQQGGGAYYHLETGNSPCPEVTGTCESYNISNNDFQYLTNANGEIPGYTTPTEQNKVYSWQNLPNVKTLRVDGNYFLDDDTGVLESNGIVSSALEGWYGSSTGLPLPQLRNKLELKQVEHYYLRPSSTFFESGSYKFSGCIKLEKICLYYSSQLTGKWPVFNNPALKEIDVRYTGLTGGGGETAENPSGYSASTYAIPPNILENCSELENFWFYGSSVSYGSQLGYELFESCSALRNLQIYCYGRLSGSVPNLNGLGSLQYVSLYWNGLTGTLPSFAGSTSINGVQLQGNNFTGNIPGYTNLTNLRFLYVHNNQLDGSIGEFTNLTNLYYFYAHNNRLTGALPSFSGVPNIRYIILFNNNLTGYIGGALTSNTRMSYLDLSNNDFVQTALDQLIDDLYTNYQTSPRGGVTINLKNIRNNGVLVVPSEEQLDKVEQLRNSGWNVKLD